MATLRPLVLGIHEDHTISDLMRSEPGAQARKLSRTFVAARGRLRQAPWTRELATDFVGAGIFRNHGTKVFVGIIAPIADDLVSAGGVRDHECLWMASASKVALAAVRKDLQPLKPRAPCGGTQCGRPGGACMSPLFY